MRFIELAGEINTSIPHHVMEAVSSALDKRGKPVNGSRVLVAGRLSQEGYRRSSRIPGLDHH
jgi:UDP-N-acetyl-D-mannosaminuronate dehydrogenase